MNLGEVYITILKKVLSKIIKQQEKMESNEIILPFKKKYLIDSFFVVVIFCHLNSETLGKN